jgi:prophage regulatory protein
VGFFRLLERKIIMDNTSTHTKTTPIRILRWPEVARRIPFSKSYAYALQARGLFPKPIKLIEGGRASGYIESEIEEYVKNRIASSRQSNDE